MFQRILVVFENQGISQEAVVYARELARRMNAQTVLLTLLDKTLLRQGPGQGDPDLPQALAKAVADFQADGLAVSTALKVGDPAQDLRAFLEQGPPFQALIWGSGSAPPAGRQGRRHWLKRMANTLKCPLLTVSNQQHAGRADTPPAFPSPEDQGETDGHSHHFQRDGRRAPRVGRKPGQETGLRRGQPRAAG